MRTSTLGVCIVMSAIASSHPSVVAATESAETMQELQEDPTKEYKYQCERKPYVSKMYVNKNPTDMDKSKMTDVVDPKALDIEMPAVSDGTDADKTAAQPDGFDRVVKYHCLRHVVIPKKDQGMSVLAIVSFAMMGLMALYGLCGCLCAKKGEHSHSHDHGHSHGDGHKHGDDHKNEDAPAETTADEEAEEEGGDYEYFA